MTTTTWPDQILLSGQAAAPEGPLDMWMMYVTHHAYRRDLAKFCAAAQATPAGARRSWRALLARWELALESTRRPELEAALRAAGARVRERVAATLDGLGIADPARRADDLVACLDGLAFDQLAGAGRPPRDAAGLRASITDVVHGFTAPRA